MAKSKKAGTKSIVAPQPKAKKKSAAKKKDNDPKDPPKGGESEGGRG
jgi:hypothetical protein